jgi:AcrR family transcriptional regulator
MTPTGKNATPGPLDSMTPHQPSNHATIRAGIDGRSPLQQRRHEATRFEIAEAAANLFIEHGFETTTVEQIATAAGISLRTFYRYCNSKDDVLTSVLVTAGASFVELIASGPLERPLAEVVISAVLTAMEDQDHPNLRRNASTIVLRTPGLRQRWLSIARDNQEDLALVLAARLRWQPDSLAASALAAMVGSAVTSAVEHSLLTDAPLAESLRETLAMLDSGLATIETTALSAPDGT